MSDEASRYFDVSDGEPAVPDAPKPKVLAVRLHADGTLDFVFPQGSSKTELYGLIELLRAELDKIFLLQGLKPSPPRGGVEGLLRRMKGGS